MIQLSLPEFYTLVGFLVTNLVALVGILISWRKSRLEQKESSAQVAKLTEESDKIEAETGLTLSQTLKNNIDTLGTLQTQLDTAFKKHRELQGKYDEQVEEYKRLFVKNQLIELENARFKDQIKNLDERVQGLEADLRLSREQNLAYFHALEEQRKQNIEKDINIQGLQALSVEQEHKIEELKIVIRRLSQKIATLEKDTGRLTTTSLPFRDRQDPGKI